jgi:lipopolysaccharide transport system ATP-binding protein
MAFIIAENVSIDFPLYHGSARSLKKTVLAAASGSRRLGQDQRHRMIVRALRNVSFQLQPGDRLGLVGDNGAGKTTLLRSLAGIYEPAEGRVIIQGSMNVLIDPNLGLNMDLTGQENIMLRGQYHGLDREQIRVLQEDVRQFAELDDFLDLPLRIYSSGMVVRLAFALATAVRPQVLLMDEWFLAGDTTFLRKAQSRLEDLVRSAEILVLSSHQYKIIETWCNRVLWLEQGQIKADGAPAEVLQRYLGRSDSPLAA